MENCAIYNPVTAPGGYVREREKNETILPGLRDYVRAWAGLDLEMAQVIEPWCLIVCNIFIIGHWVVAPGSHCCMDPVVTEEPELQSMVDACIGEDHHADHVCIHACIWYQDGPTLNWIWMYASHQHGTCCLIPWDQTGLRL